MGRCQADIAAAPLITNVVSGLVPARNTFFNDVCWFVCGELHTRRRQLTDFLEGVASGAEAGQIGRVSPPPLGFVVISNSYLGHNSLLARFSLEQLQGFLLGQSDVFDQDLSHQAGRDSGRVVE